MSAETNIKMCFPFFPEAQGKKCCVFIEEGRKIFLRKSKHGVETVENVGHVN